MDLSGELARTLLELAPDATVVVDGHGTVVFANAQVESTFGFTAAELIGSPVERLLPERFRAVHPEHRAQFGAAPKPRPMGAGLKLLGLHKDGREFPVEISLSPVATAEGLLIVGAIRDATARKDAESYLVEQNRAKSRFLAAASHDLRQPLQTLSLLNRVATHQADDNSQLLEVLDRQQRALDSMSGLLASVLDISKLDSGAVIPHPADCPLRRVFDQLVSDFEPQAAAKGLRLTVTAPRVAVHTDPVLLQRLLGNLVSNAIRYTSRGEIRVGASPVADHVAISVADTGLGIPPAERTRIFEEFYQIDHGAQRPEGLGLGLSIVARLATLLGLDLDLESEVGRGTVLTLRVPRRELSDEPETRDRPSVQSDGGRILVVDDEPAVAEATRLLLRIEGYDVAVASGVTDAVGQVERSTPDLIISDYQLRGGETGVEVVKTLRKRLGPETPVIFVTGDTARSTADRASLENADFVSKPIRADELLALIHRALRARRAAAESSADT